METVEESLNDTAHFLSAQIESKIPSQNPFDLKSICETLLRPSIQNLRQHQFEAKIYGVTKKESDIQIYITDNQGIVIFDSEKYREGLDYSKFNDVYLTLKGKYGARSSKIREDIEEGALFVAAPIKGKYGILGVVTVIKPKLSVVPFISLAREKFWRISLIVGMSIAIVFSLLAFVLFRPISKLSLYVQSLRKKERIPFPKIGISELESLGQEINLLIQELEGKRYIENYVRTLTHEIKSPLSSLIAAGELIDASDEKNNRLKANIQNEANRIKEMIERLLELSTLEGKSNLDLESIELSQTIHSIADELEMELSIKKISLVLSLKNVYIKGNREYLKIAIRNLLRNSLQFANEGDTISIRIEDTPEIILSVEDEGQWIPEYALEKVTERFYSLPRPDTKLKSTGLGLNLVKEICLLHSARFEIKNRKTPGVSAKIFFAKT
ncbi:GHKL domain protein [Leptospira ryugenii]|uniref:histidine kinase n=1 Tax=Leptospira ryugenii TaxID=1917863 RepID=A0A2P2E2C2_9LEPT|nr:GHKL domain protein [Leptospira ryugenii]